jgi:hypothetical protein
MAGRPPTTALARELHNAASETVLKRVTIVAARPDDTVLYLQADYSSTTAESLADAEPSMSAAAAGNAVASLTGMAARISPQASPASGRYSSSRGIELYASTQRMLAETPMTHIDVHA